MRGAGSSGGFRSLRTATDVDDLVALVHHLATLLPRPRPVAAEEGTATEAVHGLPPQSPGGQAVTGERLPQVAAPPLPDGPAAVPAAKPSDRGFAFVGYSYGSVVAARALPLLGPHVAALVTVGLPMGALSRVFLGSLSAWEALSSDAARGLPRLLACGDRDQFTDAGSLEAAISAAQQRDARAAAAGAESGPADAATAGDHVAAAHELATCAAGPAPAGGAGSTDGASACSLASSSSLEHVPCPGCDHFFFACADWGALAAALAHRAAALGAHGWQPSAGGRPLATGARPAVALADFVVLWLRRKLRLADGGGE
ncbi:hypothetical protein GPECTOR_90g536 [Gonium pectorale]|uniref:DUF1023 domain-containing protein n=1 Tax=Gonium pectorale TaxID=33097 RepID=A0A150G0R9_GONPE|nr:hypothetical protein GPECTOR_90g536 [Gonium pectorale]|eukprot:KXZ43449.1 hypothetical protein GPECTOR_90g536 [Gonium pectorale]